MKASDRAVVMGVGIVLLLAAFWVLILSPKRQEASDLETKVTELQGEVATAEQLAATAQAAKDTYARNYRRIVVLGKAAPADGDTPSLVEQLQVESEHAKVDFRSLVLASSGSVAPPPAPAPTDAQATPPGDGGAGATPASNPTADAVATEAAVSVLPLGASVGPAGLPVLPYDLTFDGGFFGIADLLHSLDRRVVGSRSKLSVDGRLFTINGFDIAIPATGGGLKTTLSLTSYVLPDSQGLTAGATGAAPPGSIPPATPSTVSETTPAPTP